MGRRVGVSAQVVGVSGRKQMGDAKDKGGEPRGRGSDGGVDGRGREKEQQRCATSLSEQTNPQQPEVLAVAPGKDEAAARQCLEKLSAPQRRGVQAYRADMAVPFHNVCRELLPKAKPVVDRFHVAQKFNEAIDSQRKKNHAGVPGEAVEGSAEGVSRPAVGVPSRPLGSHPGAAAGTGGVIPETAPVADAVRTAATLPEDL